MRYAFTGDRYWHRDYFSAIWDFMEIDIAHDDHLILGDCPTGVDAVALFFAEKVLKNIVTHEVHKADWDKYGKGAGHIRNGEMLKAKPDYIIAVHKNFNNSKGTLNCVKQAKKLEIPVIYLLDKA